MKSIDRDDIALMRDAAKSMALNPDCTCDALDIGKCINCQASRLISKMFWDHREQWFTAMECSWAAIKTIRELHAQSAKNVAVGLKDLGKTGRGPWRLFIRGLGVADFPIGRAGSEDPKAYAEEVLRCVKKALRES